MTYGVIVQNRVAALNVDAYNRPAWYTSALANGSVFRLDSLASLTGSEVWLVSAPSGDSSTLNNLWMAYSPEIVITTSGTKQYKGIDPDPQDFTNSASLVFDAFKPQVGDIITMTGDCFANSVSTYANAVSGSTNLTWGSTQTASALSLKLLDSTYISKPDGTISTGRVTAYKCVVVAN
jgi:hypothetical protein